MYACDYLERGFLNVLRGNTFAAPSKCYLGLYINDPGETGTAGIEISYPGYTRMEIAFSEPAAANGGIGIQSLSDIRFPAPETAAGTAAYLGILDSLSGGNMLARNELTEPLVIGTNQPPVLLAGDITLYFPGNLSTAYKTRLLNLFRGQSLAGITPHVSLWNGNPENAGAELSGDNYARAPITFSGPSEQENGQLLAANTSPVTFNRPSTAWGTCSWTAIYSAASGGQPVYVQRLPEPVEVKRGYMPTYDTGKLQVGIN